MRSWIISAWTGGLAYAFLYGLTPAFAHAQSQTVSPENLSQVSPHVWMMRGFPIIGFVVGTLGTLVIDTGLGAKNGQIVAGVARRLSTKSQKLYLTRHTTTQNAHQGISASPRAEWWLLIQGSALGWGSFGPGSFVLWHWPPNIIGMFEGFCVADVLPVTLR